MSLLVVKDNPAHVARVEGRGSFTDESVQPRSMRKGLMANLLNPHPYLFWFVIGAPTLLKAWTTSLLAAVLFLIGLYVCLVGSKILIAWLVARSRRFLQSRATSTSTDCSVWHSSCSRCYLCGMD